MFDTKSRLDTSGKRHALIHLNYKMSCFGPSNNNCYAPAQRGKHTVATLPVCPSGILSSYKASTVNSYNPLIWDLQGTFIGLTIDILVYSHISPISPI